MQKQLDELKELFNKSLTELKNSEEIEELKKDFL
jgi:ABC-type amino acid transport substrate-binding protein